MFWAKILQMSIKMKMVVHIYFVPSRIVFDGVEVTHINPIEAKKTSHFDIARLCRHYIPNNSHIYISMIQAMYHGKIISVQSMYHTKQSQKNILSFVNMSYPTDQCLHIVSLMLMMDNLLIILQTLCSKTLICIF